MAPLKQLNVYRLRAWQTLYPWLRGHGSIEAVRLRPLFEGMSPYPWLRGHGSIEALRRTPTTMMTMWSIHG